MGIQQARKTGLALAHEDRKREGLVLGEELILEIVRPGTGFGDA